MSFAMVGTSPEVTAHRVQAGRSLCVACEVAYNSSPMAEVVVWRADSATLFSFTHLSHRLHAASTSFETLLSQASTSASLQFNPSIPHKGVMEHDLTEPGNDGNFTV